MSWNELARLSVIGAVLALSGSIVGAQDKTIRPGEISADGPSESIRKKRAVVADQLAKISAPEKENEKPDGARDTDNQNTLTLLRLLDGLYAQHQTLLERRQQSEAQLKEADKELKSLDTFEPDEPKPYSFLLLDSLKDQLDVEEDREAAIKADVKSAKSLLQAAHDDLDAAQRDRRKQVKGDEKERPDADGSTDQRVRADLTDSIALEKVSLKQAEIEFQRLRLSLCKTVQKQLSKKIDAIKKDVIFSARDRDKQLERLAGSEAEPKRRRKEAETHLQGIESERNEALKELADQKASQNVMDTAAEAWRVAGDVYQTQIVILDQQLENLREIRRFWKRRFELATKTVEPARMSRWLDDLDEFLDQLDDMSGSLEHRRDSLRDDQSAAKRGATDGEDEALTNWKSFRDARLRELRDLSETRLAEIKATQGMLGRFRSELKAKLKANPGSWTALAGNYAKSFLGYKVAEDDEQSVTVGRLLILLLYIVVGIVLAYSLSRLIGRRVLLHLGMHRGTADALKSIMFYALCIFFGMLAFQMLNIPMAAFAFLGGAAAIAVGFGGQDIMNNFMSGIILLTEQPIRVGDVVQIDDVQGIVLHIGLRSTRLQTQANHELIVPNKTLLDEQVTNLTLSDNFVQMFVTVTLDRVVSVQPAKAKMLEVVFSHPLVLKSPRPVILLKEFDTYWSTFDVHFWLEYANFMKCAVVQSQILEGISELFPQAESTDSSSPSSPEATLSDDSAPAAMSENGAASPKMNMMTKAVIAKQLKRVGNLTKLKA
jgi:potassium-dependent mechanosensitive channel